MGKKKADQLQKNKSKLIMKGNPRGYFKNDTIMQFCVSKKTNLYKKVFDNPLYPIFNKDGKFYTPGFTLPFAQCASDQDYKQNHQKKISQSLQEIQQTQILVSKPRSKNKYCGVCRDTYEDYLQHIKSQSHSQSLQKNGFHKYIKNLCHQFNAHYCNRQHIQIQKSISISTKLNEDQNSTQSIIHNDKIISKSDIFQSINLLN